VKLLAQLRQRLRVRHYSRRTEEVYVGWVKRLVRAYGMRHPAEISEQQVGAFLSALAVEGRVSASTQMQALSALLFFYREVLGRPVGHLADLVPARKPRRLPVVLTRAEVRSVLGQLGGRPRLVAALLYGAGLRLLEGLALRVKDVDFGQRQLTVRGGKGENSRMSSWSTLSPRLMFTTWRGRPFPTVQSNPEATASVGHPPFAPHTFTLANLNGAYAIPIIPDSLFRDAIIPAT